MWLSICAKGRAIDTFRQHVLSSNPALPDVRELSAVETVTVNRECCKDLGPHVWSEMTSRENSSSTRRPLTREPGLILTTVMIVYAALVFAWWPTGTMISGISLVAWLMLIGIVLWVALGFIYCFWVERLEREEGARR